MSAERRLRRYLRSLRKQEAQKQAVAKTSRAKDPHSTSGRRPHESVGTYVSVTRHAHGWEDGRISGQIIRVEGNSAIVQVKDGDSIYEIECFHRRDYNISRD